jgi:hypothetical protein
MDVEQNTLCRRRKVGRKRGGGSLNSLNTIIHNQGHIPYFI